MQAHFHFNETSYERKRSILAGATLTTIAGTIGVLAAGAGAAVAAPAVGRSLDVAAKKRKTLAAEEEKRLKAVRDGALMPEDAQAKARSEIARRKRITQLAGGRTLLTTETGIGTGVGKTLLGE